MRSQANAGWWASSRPFGGQHIRLLVTARFLLVEPKTTRFVTWLDGALPRIVFVHGSVMGGRPTWSGQRELGDRFRARDPRAAGIPAQSARRPRRLRASTPLSSPRSVGDGAHLVGHSYGGVITLLAAAAVPDAIRSLTVIEPPAMGVARGNPAVDAFIQGGIDWWQTGPTRRSGGVPARLPHLRRLRLRSPLPAAAAARAGRADADRRAQPVGGRDRSRRPRRGRRSRSSSSPAAHLAAFDAVCDVLVERLDAERLVLPGYGHTAQRHPDVQRERWRSSCAGARRPDGAG